MTAEHPAKWSANVLFAIRDAVIAERERRGKLLLVLDPFAGIGRRRLEEALGNAALRVDGFELQPEWSGWRPGCPEGKVFLQDGSLANGTGDLLTLQGPADYLPPHYGDRYDAVCTSPCYGNRMADSHQAKDPCGKCGGSGYKTDLAEGPHWTPCPGCKGSGLSKRYTYAHYLRAAGGDLVPGSAAGMAWGRDYRILHRSALHEMIRVLRPGGLLAINMSNHFRTLVKGEPAVEQDVVGWWVNQVIVAGCTLRGVVPIDTPRNKVGANADVRAECEYLITAHTPNPRRML